MLKVFPSSQVTLSRHSQSFKGSCRFVNPFPTCYMTFKIKSNTTEYFQVVPYQAVIPPAGSVQVSFQMNCQNDEDCNREIVKNQKFLVQYAVVDEQHLQEPVEQSPIQTHKLYVRFTSRRESLLASGMSPQMGEIPKQIIRFMPPDKRADNTFENLSRQVEKLEQEKSEMVRRGKKTKEGGMGLAIMMIVLIIMLILGNMLGKQIGLNHVAKKKVSQDYSYFSLDSFWENNEKQGWRWL